jgi:hypothetical protein
MTSPGYTSILFIWRTPETPTRLAGSPSVPSISPHRRFLPLLDRLGLPADGFEHV